MRFLPVFVGLLLAGCSLGEIGSRSAPAVNSSQMPEFGPLAATVQGIFKSLKLPGAPKVSHVRKAHLLAPADWILCLKSDVETDRHIYALFVRDNKIVDYRLVVVLDQCEHDQFESPENLMRNSSSAHFLY